MMTMNKMINFAYDIAYYIKLRGNTQIRDQTYKNSIQLRRFQTDWFVLITHL